MKKTISVMFVIFCLLLLQTIALADENAPAYLKAYYDISFDEVVSSDDYNNGLTALGAEPISAENFTLADAVVGAIHLAGMDELALTYSEEKTNVIKAKGISVDADYEPYIVCALDLGLIDDDNDFNGPVSGEIAASLLYRSAELCGKGRRAIDRLSDDSILNDVRNMLDSTINL